MPPRLPGRSCLTTNLVGGLGNQLFIFANMLATSMRHDNLPMALPFDKWSSSNEAPRPTYWDSIFRNMVTEFHVEDRNPRDTYQSVLAVTERRPAHDKITLDIKSDQSAAQCFNLVGFFQSEQYFADAKDAITTIFSPEDLCAGAVSRLRSCYIEHDDQYVVAMHVRRGDYLRMEDVFHVLNHSYYLNALQQLFGRLLLSETTKFFAAQKDKCSGGDEAKRKLIRVLIFSEDKRFAQTLAGVIESKYGGVSCAVVGEDYERQVTVNDGDPVAPMPREVLELLMMASCQDVVIANSSFSWWGGYLNQLPGRRVVAPAQWFKQEQFPEAARLYPATWLIL